MDDQDVGAQGAGGAKIDSLGKAIDAAAARDRKGEPPDPELLKQLNMNTEQYSSFVKKYKDRFDRQRQDSAAGGNSQDQLVQDQANRPGTDRLQTGQGVGQGIGGINRQADVQQDQQRKLREAERANLSDELRQIVEDYHKVISGGQQQSP